MSARPMSFSASIISGMSVRCPAASELAPTTSTSCSTAICAVSRGVWNSGPGDHFEAQIGEGRGDQVGAAVVAVLAHLGDHDPGLAAEPFGDRSRALLRRLSSARRAAPCRRSRAPARALCRSARTRAPAHRKFRRACSERAPLRRKGRGGSLLPGTGRGTVDGGEWWRGAHLRAATTAGPLHQFHWSRPVPGGFCGRLSAHPMPPATFASSRPARTFSIRAICPARTLALSTSRMSCSSSSASR